MKQRTSHCQDLAIVIGALLYAAGVLVNPVHAQVTTSITPDGSLGTTVTPAPGNVYNIDGGTINGTNQFHSFGQFSVGAGDAAVFNGPATIQNIISRVTGGVVSEIDGTLASNIAGANLWLLNPAGIMFGPNAQLAVDGSFHASTADYIKLGSDGIFYADPAKASALTVSPPSAFGFLTSTPAAIDVDTSNILIFQVPFMQTLSFVGGPVNVGAPDGSAPGYVMAPGGRLNLVSVASPGEATFDGTGFNVDSFAQLGDIRIQGGSIVDANEVVIRGGQLAIDEAVIMPGAFSLFGLGPPPDGGEVNIKVSGGVTMTGTAPEPFTQAPPGILAFNGAFDSIAPAAKVPDITINADSVSLSGYASVQTDRYGPGDPPNLVVNANSVTVENGAGIALFNFLEGAGGYLTVNAQQVTLSGGGVAGGAVGVTGLLAQGLFHPIYMSAPSTDPAVSLSDSGTVTVNATQSLTMSGGAQITTDSRSFGKSDDINVNAGDMFLSDRGGVISAQSLAAGDSGNVKITASGQITIDNGFVIAANTYGSGESGNVEINAGQGITISGTASGIASQTTAPPAAQLDAFASVYLGPGTTFADLVAALNLDPATANIFTVLAGLADYGLVPALKLTPGDGGNITVTTPSLTVSGVNSAIDSGTAWDGNAGSVQVNVGSVSVSDGAQIRSRSGIVNLDTGILGVGTGNAGLVSVAATGTLSITGTNSSISTSTFGAGSGGAINLSANQVQISNSGSVTADSTGTGFTGDITINAGDQIVMTNGSVSTRAVTSDGGNIELTAPNMIQLTDSQVSTSVESGIGGGGNITIDPQFVILNKSSVTANAYGGPGGNILIVAQNYIPSVDSTVEASSAKNVQGTVQINSPDNNIAGSIAQLPQNYVDPSALLPAPCVARHSGAQSTFVVSGRGGVAVDPDNYLPSFTRDEALPGGAGNAAGVKADAGFRQDERIALARASWECSP